MNVVVATKSDVDVFALGTSEAVTERIESTDVLCTDKLSELSFTAAFDIVELSLIEDLVTVIEL